ncbi:MAG TPA: hypothetical protein VFA04_00975 [Bryobacteraceae bacterium]|nr:hypothetical protein [Bryobacteraceae bacterium]
MKDENSRSAADTISELTDAGKEMLDAGQRIAADMKDLRERMQSALDWRGQYAQHTVGMLAAAMLAGLLVGKTVT